ncbi:MAG TPA: DUF1080 domain-containing protein [Steroidobacteraceae bacterium]|nr:DUF1080 domain-containing protein [Steroidobacteraceae bacterium]
MKVFHARALRALGPIGLALALAMSWGGADAAAAAPPAKARHGAWQYVIQGDSAPLLRGWKHPGLPAGWTVHDGVLSKSGPVEDLESTRTYKDFELELQWKIGKASNSGIFYRATHQYDYIYWTGPEYQLLDDANAPDGKNRLTAAGAVYAMYPAPENVVHPYGRWNTTRIVVRGNHVEYWMNGRRIIDYDLGSADWKKRVAASKFSEYPGYGRAARGLIGIQGDHPGSIAIRDMRIRVLP